MSKPIFESEEEYIECITLTIAQDQSGEIRIPESVDYAKQKGYIKKSELEIAKEEYVYCMAYLKEYVDKANFIEKYVEKYVKKLLKNLKKKARG